MVGIWNDCGEMVLKYIKQNGQGVMGIKDNIELEGWTE